VDNITQKETHSDQVRSLGTAVLGLTFTEYKDDREHRGSMSLRSVLYLPVHLLCISPRIHYNLY